LKNLAILLFAFLVATVLFSGVGTEGNSSKETGFYCVRAAQTALLFGDFELSPEDEQEADGLVFISNSSMNGRQEFDLKSSEYYQSFPVEAQLSPHHFTNLPPPLHLITMYS